MARKGTCLENVRPVVVEVEAAGAEDVVEEGREGDLMTFSKIITKPSRISCFKSMTSVIRLLCQVFQTQIIPLQRDYQFNIKLFGYHCSMLFSQFFSHVLFSKLFDEVEIVLHSSVLYSSLFSLGQKSVDLLQPHCSLKLLIYLLL